MHQFPPYKQPFILLNLHRYPCFFLVEFGFEYMWEILMLNMYLISHNIFHSNVG